MRDALFLTGGSGFVGRRLLGALQNAGRPIVALDRSGSLSQAASPLAGVTVLRGDLLEPETYRQALQSCDVVLHLAAATGRAPAAEHMRVNARGTDVLLRECRQAGVEKFLFVSSIAATFQDQAGYPYAHTKRLAEEAVRRSGVRFLILRPTIVLGPGSPILGALERIALLPIVVIPGSGRVKVQPIHADDLVEAIAGAVRHERFANETVEIGGPETLTIEALLQRIRQARGASAGPVLRIPLGLIQVPLRAAEAAGLGRVLPVTAGQLASFRHDGVAAPGGLAAALGAQRFGVSQMLAPAEGSSSPSNVLDAECRVFTRHLLDCDPDDYVRARYAAAHAALPALAASSPLDGPLLAFARRGPLFAKVADAYASVLAPGAALRKKLVVLLAILETRLPFHQTIDRAIGGPVPLLWAKLTVRVVAGVTAFLAGVLIFLPARAILALRKRSGV